MRPRILLAASLACPLLALACSSSPGGDDDAATDAAPDNVLGELKDAGDASSDAIAAQDVVDEQLLDAPADDEDQGAPDADADVLDAGASDGDAASLGGDVCPIFGSTTCTQGFEFRTHPANDASTDYNCGAVVPHCPKGWTCWALNTQNQPVYATCP